MTTLTFEVPAESAKNYEFAFSTLIKNYSVEDLEDLCLGLLIDENKKIDDFGTEEEFLQALQS